MLHEVGPDAFLAIGHVVQQSLEANKPWRRIAKGRGRLAKFGLGRNRHGKSSVGEEKSSLGCLGVLCRQHGQLSLDILSTTPSRQEQAVRTCISVASRRPTRNRRELS